MVLGLGIAAGVHAPIRDIQFGVFGMQVVAVTRGGRYDDLGMP